jgi:hypothetical protein
MRKTNFNRGSIVWNCANACVVLVIVSYLPLKVGACRRNHAQATLCKWFCYRSEGRSGLRMKPAIRWIPQFVVSFPCSLDVFDWRHWLVLFLFALFLVGSADIMHGWMLSWLTSIVNFYHEDQLLPTDCESSPVFIQGCRCWVVR